MPRIVIRVKKKQPVSNPPADFPAADAGGDAVDGPSSASSQPKPQNTPNPSPKHPKEKETINCILNTHVTHLSTDSENTSDSGSCDAVEMLPLLQRKRPRKKPPTKTASGHAMPPLSPSADGGRGGSPGSKNSPVPNRNLDDTYMDGSGGSPSSMYNDGVNRPILRSMVKKRSYSESLKIDSNWFIDPQAMGGSVAAAGAEYQSMGGINEKIQWPKIQIELSRKEKAEDFFSMYGTKLHLRPKRRAKPVEKAVQNCYPGMSLEDVTKARYEVRGERKNAKKKRRGLRGMITDSD